MVVRNQKFTAFIDSRIHKAEPEKIEVVPEDYEATKKQAEEYKARLDAIEKEAQFTARVVKFETDIKATDANPELAKALAGLPDDTAEAIMREFRALSERIKVSNIVEEKGTEGAAVEDPKAAFNALVLKYSAEKGVPYNRAFEIVKAENKELFTAWSVREK